MAETRMTAALNASGHLVQQAESELKGSGVAGEALALGDIVVLDSVSGKLKKHTGAAEAGAGAIVGVADGAYVLDDPCNYFQDGDEISALAGFTAGDELWAKEDASLDTYANVTATKWTRPMGVALSTTAVQLQIGDVVQKP